MVRPAAKRSGLGSKQEAAGSNVFGGSDKDITDKEITNSIVAHTITDLSGTATLLCGPGACVHMVSKVCR